MRRSCQSQVNSTRLARLVPGSDANLLSIVINRFSASHA